MYTLKNYATNESWHYKSFDAAKKAMRKHIKERAGKWIKEFTDNIIKYVSDQKVKNSEEYEPLLIIGGTIEELATNPNYFVDENYALDFFTNGFFGCIQDYGIFLTPSDTIRKKYKIPKFELNTHIMDNPDEEEYYFLLQIPEDDVYWDCGLVNENWKPKPIPFKKAASKRES